ncbi:hypothetical protein [Treponema endosymbiont of Eucomonympha sp.]|nr:hypothetical protein [Treponema endosymbiont of Eucomonympha sp.]
MSGEAAIKPIVRISGYCGYRAGFVGVSTQWGYRAIRPKGESL